MGEPGFEATASPFLSIRLPSTTIYYSCALMLKCFFFLFFFLGGGGGGEKDLEALINIT